LSELLSHSEPISTSTHDTRWALVLRVASSRHLLKAPQLREILLYLCRRVLTDNPSAISEQEIGCKVLGRRADFNPNEDNIVRVQVRHLRKKLEEYFSSEGLEEPVILTIPKGAYLPHFEPRSAQPLPIGGDCPDNRPCFQVRAIATGSHAGRGSAGCAGFHFADFMEAERDAAPGR
jgi:hypothetical protein